MVVLIGQSHYLRTRTARESEENPFFLTANEMEQLQQLSGGFMEAAKKCSFGSIPNWYIAVAGVVLLLLVGGFVAYRFYFPAKSQPQEMNETPMRMPTAAEMPPPPQQPQHFQQAPQMPPQPQHQQPVEEFDDDQYQQNLNTGDSQEQNQQ